MNWITKILGGSLGGVVEQVGNIADRFHLSGEEKQQFKLELESLLQKRDSEVEQTLRSELQAKERILVAELSQGDAFTKRARPTVVYAGLGFIAFNYCIVPVFSKLAGADIAALQLPPAFWAGWSGIVATWTVGRTVEKRGANSRLTSAITGTPVLSKGSRLVDDTEVKG